jgi:purine-cytosine permease-like protein
MPASTHSDDDYASSPVPEHARTSWGAIFFATLGIATALFFAQIASIITVKFGVAAALIGLVYGYCVSAFVGVLLVRRSIETGFGINIWARTVLGYRGAGLFSLAYGLACLTYFVAEASIMGASLQALFPDVPRALIYVCLVVVMLPLVWPGMKVLAKFQAISLMLFVVFVAWAMRNAFALQTRGIALPAIQSGVGSFRDLLEVLGIVNGLAFIIGLVTADYARFVRRRELRAGTALLGALFPAFCYGITGILGVWFAVRMRESNPGIYFVSLLGAGGIVFACTTQLRINLGNIYSGTVAFVNAVEHLIGVAVSRKIVVVVFCAIAAIVLISDGTHLLASALNYIGISMACFVTLLLVDQFWVRRSRDLSDVTPEAIENWRWTGLSTCLIATLCGVCIGNATTFPSLYQWATPISVIVQAVLYLAVEPYANRRRGQPSTPSASSEMRRKDRRSGEERSVTGY